MYIYLYVLKYLVICTNKFKLFRFSIVTINFNFEVSLQILFLSIFLFTYFLSLICTILIVNFVLKLFLS